MDLGPYEYIVKRIDGDYAYLVMAGSSDEKCVARALLPEEISEGDRLLYENLQYSII
ncbi:MAG: chorismate--pyruvate lyase [Pseudobutyrivibrio sp.]|nr:chorismate--pyruvate lyase [Pseudobutyrivibrio sp.]